MLVRPPGDESRLPQIRDLMDRIWLKHYPPGVPAEIDPARYPSLVAVFADCFARFRDDRAFVCMDKALSYGEIDRLSRAFAAFLQSLGLARGDRVAVMLPNVLQYPVATIAILRAGFSVVNVNPLYTARELAFQLKDSGARAIIVLENFAAVAQEALPDTAVQHVVVASMGDLLGSIKGAIVNLVVRHVRKLVPRFAIPQAVPFNAALARGATLTLAPPAIGPDDIAFLQYTGGTTGVAKGAMLLHRNLVANLLQVDAWLQPMLAVPPKVRQMIVVTALPLYHIFALTACMLLTMRIGGLSLLIPNPRDIGGLVKELAKYKVNSFPAVNTLYNALLHHPDFGRIDWSLLKCAIGGGMAVQKAVAERWVAATGRPIVEGYGLSETSPVLCCNRGDIAEWTGTIGLPLPSTDISIRDDHDRELPPGARGEICARGPQVMPGYWQRPDETARVMTADGFFRTGDIGIMDGQGRIAIVDRKKDMISVSGFKVFPNEVEDAAMAHPGVLESAAIGVPDPASGEAVKLFAVRKDPGLTETELRAFLADRLTPYKQPRHVEFRRELPKTNVGKILRRALRDETVVPGSDVTVESIIAFWQAAGPQRWFEKDDGFDADIRARFLAAHEAAAAGRLAGWENSATGTLALLLLLDQFPRNIFRGSARAFATDAQALALAKRAIDRGFDKEVAPELRTFFYLPFMHAEDIAEQEHCVALYEAAGNADGRKWAELHADIIRRFGRFPHRNAVLGRATTPEEQAFLDAGGFAG